MHSKCSRYNNLRIARAIAGLAFCLTVNLPQNCLGVDNPVSYDKRINDCDVIKYNGEYYIHGNWLNGGMLVSRDLEHWGGEKHVYSWNNTWHKQRNRNRDKDIHASHIRYHNGFFHLYAQLDVYDGIAHAVSRSIWGPYTEPVVQHAFVDGPVIDADTFVDDNGTRYFYCDYRVGVNGHEIRAWNMSDPWTRSDTFVTQIYAAGGWEGHVVNEGSKVFKHRGRYYMLYNANGTGDPNYAIGCAEASSPTGFSNSGKYGYPLIRRRIPRANEEEIAYIGQSWVVDGMNGFEKWLGYFGQTKSGGRTQRIDRMHFFDQKVCIDGPTVRATAGYHPSPAKPQLLSLFHVPDGPLPASDWTVISPGTWGVSNSEAFQGDQSTWSFNLANRTAATNYLFEANMRFAQEIDSEDKAGVVAFYQDSENYVLAGLDRSPAGSHDNWYVHVREKGADTVYAGTFKGSLDSSVYHKIRITKNGAMFDFRIDEIIPPEFAAVKTNFSGPGNPGLFTDHASAVFDGIIYTIGWDEYDDTITGWSDARLDVSQTGTWTVAHNGIMMEKGTGRALKGDLMPFYEFSAQVYRVGSEKGLMGLVAAAVDSENYLIAQIDMNTNELCVHGLKKGSALPVRRVPAGCSDNYNVRVVKLGNEMLFFIDGSEVMSYAVTFGAARVGLAVDNMSARFNGIMAYQFEPKGVAPWESGDIGPTRLAGDSDCSEETVYLKGSGAGIGETADGCHYVYRTFEGDTELSARLVSVEKTHPEAMAVLMFRNSLQEHSAMIAFGATADNGQIRLIRRGETGSNGETVPLSVQPAGLPVWLKLKRTGSVFTAYSSADGQCWVQAGSCSLSLDAETTFGFAVTSHNPARIGKAVFDHVAP